MKILALYYTQSGQLKHILESIFSSVSQQIEIDYVAIKPQNDFPFPWPTYTFFDTMPETVLQIPTPLQPVNINENANYDLIVLGYQPWFLHPSIPINSFLHSEEAKRIFKNKPILTVIGCRNMWLNAQEKVKQQLLNLDAKLVGNIVLEDRHGNMTSTLTIIRWLIKGQKGASKRLPEAGVAQHDIDAAKRFGPIILKNLQAKSLANLHQDLLLDDAVHLNPQLVILEKRGTTQFPKFAKRIREKGLPGSAARKGTVNLFKNLLIISIFILSPITNFIARLQIIIHKKKLQKKTAYFKSIAFEKEALK